MTEPALVAPTVATALGVREAGGRPIAERLADVLRDRDLLLVLDNFEQVVAAAPLLAKLLGACPGLTILVTSRAPLHVSGEHLFPVPPLALPDPAGPPEQVAEAEAVRLFVARSRAADPAFALTAENVATAAAVCQRLDGLPLAIELAAAKVRLLPLPTLLGRLERRLPVLTGGARDQPARLRTMRDAIAWSHDLLLPRTRHSSTASRSSWVGSPRALPRRSCAGPAMLGDEVFQGIETLAEQSLVHPLGAVAGEPRFGTLETVREYGLERLAASGEEPAVRAAHAAHYLALAEQADRVSHGPAQRQWAARLEAEQDNLRAALRWAVEQGDAELGLRLGTRCTSSGACGDRPARGATGWSVSWRSAGESRPAVDRQPDARGGPGVRPRRPRRGGRAPRRRSGARPGTRRPGRPRLRAAQPRDDRPRLRPGRAGAGAVGRSAPVFPRSGRRRPRGGDPGQPGHRRPTAGRFHRGRWRCTSRRWPSSRAQRIAWLEPNLLGHVAGAATDLGDYARAATLYPESLRLVWESGDRRLFAGVLAGFAGLVAACGQPERAARLCGAVAGLIEAVGATLSPAARRTSRTPRLPRGAAWRRRRSRPPGPKGGP